MPGYTRSEKFWHRCIKKGEKRWETKREKGTKSRDTNSGSGCDDVRRGRGCLSLFGFKGSRGKISPEIQLGKPHKTSL